jgi:hypothetical protein
MRVLSDRIEYFILLGGRGDEPLVPTLNGSVWAWDGKQFNVIFSLSLKLTLDVDLVA